jgi:cell division protein FtsI (penicillin-binding protein 3)
MAAIANGGVLLRPYLVEKVVGPDGAVLQQRGREEVRRALGPSAARSVTAMLEEVVAKGTGTRAALTEYRAAGKTGTAQKVDPIRGGYSDKRLSSFVGFVPVDEPRVAILVVIDEPKGAGADVTGGMVAAPAWGAIAREALRQLGVMPEQSRENILTSAIGFPASGITDASELPDPSDAPDAVPSRGPRPEARGPAQPEARGQAQRRSAAQQGAIVKRGARLKVTLAPPG